MPDLSTRLDFLLSRRAVDRFTRFNNLLNKALSEPDPFFDGGNIEIDASCFQSLVQHSENLWEQVVVQLRERSWATSIFLSIACIEEIGKITVAKFQVIVNEQRRSSPIPSSGQRASRRNPLLSHRKKHQLAAFSGFLINSRADRILGLDNILRLLELAENGDLETIRQNSLYSSSENGLIRLPEQRRSREDAVFFATACGELLCEIGGEPPSEFERLLTKVTTFENEFPLEGYRITVTA